MRGWGKTPAAGVKVGLAGKTVKSGFFLLFCTILNLGHFAADDKYGQTVRLSRLWPVQARSRQVTPILQPQLENFRKRERTL